MKNLVKIVILVMCLLIVGCSEKKEVGEPAPRLVKSVVVKDKSSVRFTYPAIVDSSERADLSFEVSGTLIEVRVKAGHKVERDQVVARLDPREFELSVSGAKAKYETASSDVERNRPLAEKEYISKSSFDRLIAIRDVAKVDLDTAEKKLSDTYLRAPFSGIVAREPIDNFQTVEAKQAILMLQKLKDIEISLNIPAGDIVFKNGEDSRVVVTFEDLPGREFEATLKSFATVADSETQTYRAVLTMPSPSDVNILPGMAATATARGIVETKRFSEEAFSLPVNSVLGDEKGAPFVWLVDEKSMTVYRQPVKTSGLTDASILISGGVKVGDIVVTAGGAYLEEGKKVRIAK